ncbi:hypothetical protein PENCOP_c002G01836 [Penicillium coprophilum]|uniref:F-box domain-containing protein n=1 Tax=Penicillium coprophilum TaxID=36646 RepID=A0A1V6V0C9_9EURO|nr:hypothetical protein PENCOP_c002G01836 [Penicillium coprophilum]
MDTNHIAANRAFILELPDELLDAIICATEPVAQIRIHGFEHSFKVYETGIVLSLVCKRFYRITVPYLYADLMVSTSDNAWGEKKLHRTFRENPSLWPLCQNLMIGYDTSNIGNLYVATDCITWLAAAKTLTFWELEGKKGWDLLRLATEQRSRCNSLSFCSTESYNINLLSVVDILGDFKSGFLPHLKTLSLCGVSTYGDQMCQEALSQNTGMASFTKLQLRSFLLSPKSLEGLVRWSRRLEEFELRYTFGDDFCASGVYEDWTLATLQPILSIHRKSLRSITLYAVGWPGSDGFDLREFENLEELSLSSEISGHQRYEQRGNLEPPDGLLAPRLRAFHWDLTLIDQQCREVLCHFAQPEEDWLRLLAYKAIERGCPLQKISIKYTPEDWGRVGNVYPWDRMDAIGADLRSHGIGVSYNAPSVSREQFLKTAEYQPRENLYEIQQSPELAGETERIGHIMGTEIILPTA